MKLMMADERINNPSWFVWICFAWNMLLYTEYKDQILCKKSLYLGNTLKVFSSIWRIFILTSTIDEIFTSMNESSVYIHRPTSNVETSTLSNSPLFLFK